MKPSALLFALLIGTSAMVACGHSSTQEATADCKNLQASIPDNTGDAFNACVACFENCSDCELKGTSPATFQCPGDKSEGGAGGTGATSSSSTGK